MALMIYIKSQIVWSYCVCALLWLQSTYREETPSDWSVTIGVMSSPLSNKNKHEIEVFSVGESPALHSKDGDSCCSLYTCSLLWFTMVVMDGKTWVTQTPPIKLSMAVNLVKLVCVISSIMYKTLIRVSCLFKALPNMVQCVWTLYHLLVFWRLCWAYHYHLQTQP